MDTKTCTMCIIEKHINNFSKSFKCKDCNGATGLERYYGIKNKHFKATEDIL